VTLPLPTSTLPACTSPVAGQDLFVLHDRRLRTDVELEQTARFSDDVWRLSPAQLQRHARGRVLNFLALPADYRQVSKQLCYALLSGPLPLGESRRPSIDSVHRVHTELKRFLPWLAARQPGRALAELVGADLLDYQRHLIARLLSTAARQGARSAIRYLWRYRANLSGDRLLFDPLHIDGWGEPTATRSTENATNRIPEPVLGPLITWSLRFVDEFSVDILVANGQWWTLRDRSRLNRAGVNSGVQDKLRQVLDRHRDRGQPLPGRQGRLNIQFLAGMVGCHVISLDLYRHEIDAAVRELGVATYSSFDIPITATLDGRPWTDGIVSDQVTHGLAHLSRLLHTACYILIAYLSGMRDSEIKHLRRGCLSTERDTRGTAYRWKIASLAFKGERDPTGVEATWVVGHPAARAITVLEQLQAPDTDLLFTVLRNGSGAGSASRASNSVLSSSATNERLNDFVGWVNDYCATHGRADGIPPFNGKPWHLVTRCGIQTSTAPTRSNSAATRATWGRSRCWATGASSPAAAVTSSTWAGCWCGTRTSSTLTRSSSAASRTGWRRSRCWVTGASSAPSATRAGCSCGTPTGPAPTRSTSAATTRTR
jgi:hypothetical protein